MSAHHHFLVCSRSQQLEEPLAAKEDPSESELAIASDGNPNPEAHLPSICLKQVFPKYAKHFNYLRLVDRMANLFIRFLGIKGTMKLGPTGFRTFIRSVSPAFSAWVSGGVESSPTFGWSHLPDYSWESLWCWVGAPSGAGLAQQLALGLAHSRLSFVE